MKFTARLLVLIFPALFAGNMYAQSQGGTKLYHPNMLAEVYQSRQGAEIWYADNVIGLSLRNYFKDLLDSCANLGLDPERYHYRIIVSGTLSEKERELVYTDALISYCKDLKYGVRDDKRVSYNGLTLNNAASDSILTSKLTAISTRQDIEQLVNSFALASSAYSKLLQELRSLPASATDKRQQLEKSLNTYRWIESFGFNKYILVNVASPQLSYYENDSLALQMKIVAGKPSTPTPRFAAFCNEIILYPYWHVPRSIAVHEILPMVKKNPAALTTLKIEVIDRGGKVIYPNSVNWSSYNKSNMPYTFRQTTGCYNALGVVKFNLTSPYSVYLHDTNIKSVFAYNNRFLSHGCMRVEQPVALAHLLLPGQIDDKYLAACVRNQKPVIHKLAQQVPVFVLYMTADVGLDSQVHYYPDVYRLN